MVELQDQETWDEDDVIMFSFGNAWAAKECHLKKATEDARHIEQWRGDVPQGLVYRTDLPPTLRTANDGEKAG